MNLRFAKITNAETGKITSLLHQQIEGSQPCTLKSPLKRQVQEN